MTDTLRRPPRDDLFRGVRPIEFRAAATGESGDGHLTGHFAVFNQWTEINSIWEGQFLERFAPGAFKKTMRDNRDSMRCLFQHGRDPQVGNKPLGNIESLAEDGYGAGYDVSLFDTSYNRDLLPGLEAGAYGASFRFSVVREDLVREPKASEYNPTALPERTVREAGVAEFGPVTFPAYAGASAGIRSLTDDMLIRLYAQDPERVRQMLGAVAPSPQISGVTDGDADPPEAPPGDAAQEGTSRGRREGSSTALRPLAVIRNPNRRRTA
jgi:HK97 family phage prohead protease